MNAVTTKCPACEAAVELDIEDLEEGECVVCDQCHEALIVVSVEPLELEVDEEGVFPEDDDEDDDEDVYDGYDDYQDDDEDE